MNRDDNNYSERNSSRRRHNSNEKNKRTHRRHLSEDERIKRQNDKRREFDQLMRGKKTGFSSESDDSRRKTKRDRYTDEEGYPIEKDNLNFDDIKTFIKNTFSKIKNTKHKGRKLFKAAKIIIALFLVISVLSVMGLFMNIKNTITTKAESPGLFKPVNILVLGMDIGAVGQENDDSIKRTDTIMLVNYNPKTKATKIVSIPRDTKITENNSNYKINAAYVKGGDKKVKQVVEDLLGIKVNYTVKVNYEAFRNVIDAIGGVDMDITQDMIYDDDGQNLHINFKGGTTVHLDGKKAEEFFRWRKNNDGTGLATGDIGRIENQHKFIQKVIKKFANPITILRMPIIFTSIGKNIDTNMGAFNILRYSLKFLIHKNKMEMVTLEGTPKMIGGQSYLVLDNNKNKNLIDSLSGKNVTSSSSNSDVSSKKILVLNGTDKNGLANEVKIKLQSAGYKNIEVGNAASTKKTIIKTDDSELKNSIKDIIDKSKNDSLPDEYSGYDAVIVLGNDYK